MPGGRPTDYREEYCEEIIKFMSNGGSFASFAASIDVCRDTLNEWANTHPEFSAAKKRANDKRVAWWERRACDIGEGITNGQASTMTIFMLKNSAPELYNEKPQEQNVHHHFSNVDLSKLSLDQLEALKSATITK